jgi:hypothetical protein
VNRLLRSKRASILLVGMLVLSAWSSVRPASAGSIVTFSFVSKPVLFKGYQMYIATSKSNVSLHTGFQVHLLKVFKPVGKPAYTEEHIWDFDLTLNSLTVDPALGSGTLNTGKQLGTFGRAVLTFGNAAGPQTTNLGCTKFKTRAGTLTGNLTFNTGIMDFGKLKKSSLPANATKANFDTDCTPDIPCVYATTLIGQHDDDAIFSAAKTPKGVEYVFSFPEKVAPADIVHLRSGRAPATAVKIAGNLKTASFDTGGLAAVSGKVTFSATVPTVAQPNDCGNIKYRRGKMGSPGIDVHFDAGPVRALTAVGDAGLTQQLK